MNDGGLIDQWKSGRGRINPARDSGLIPTWQVGQEQAPSGDIRRYMNEGYGRNSLLFSCIAEKATSFAPLLPKVERRGGTIAEGHRLTMLLEDPNDYQDGQDFQELLMTQFEAAGNAYVQKVRVSANAERRQKFATFPVQELRLIRPDYIKIVPGATPELDVFEVHVEGEYRQSIPRRDMIHIHEPLVVNDFYGEPKIARLLRETSIDMKMSDFELAFFNNAGVPMGLLSVKGNVSENETKAIKSRFRQAYNGARKWFDLLVLNADNATYTQMGMKQSDMEMDSTRFHVESRTCSVFGVPGVIVGARFAMTAGVSTDTEAAEHQFWAETMVPGALRFARAWTKFLLPEFAVGADRGARVTYDFTVVRALQEDRSRKLREVVRLILTGGFTVNQALVLSGMPAQTDGDFFVRNGNQVIVSVDGTIQPMAPAQADPAPNLDNPLEGAAKLAVQEAERLTVFRR